MSGRRLRVAFVSPTWFGPESVVGGGERYAEELARAMAAEAEVKLVTFGTRPRRDRPVSGLERVVLRSWTRSRLSPFSPRLAGELAGADVVHCFQYHTLPTFVAALSGRLRRVPVFVSDLGGSGWTPAYHVDQSRWIAAHLPISRYAARALAGRNRRHRVVWGGVDPARWPMRPEPAHDGSVAFLGRLLPHKGVHHLVEALPAGTTLHLIGTEAAPEYLERILALGRGKDVRLHRGLPDAAVVRFLQRAMALVHPTPVDANGSAGAAELLGLAPIEAMACGCPVVASDAASLPEVVADGVAGLLVPPNRPQAIAAALGRLAADPELWRRLSAGARARVEAELTWERTAERCLDAYADGGIEEG